MLIRLIIENYALIEKLEIEFGGGLSIITGGTGAGKSIMLGALSLLMGSRAENITRPMPQEKTVVEAHFNLTDKSDVEMDIAAMGAELSADHVLILRREISAQGRSRGFVNDSPAALRSLSEITNRLIDIHSQHSNLLIGSESFRLSILDALADNEGLRSSYRALFYKYIALRRDLNSRREQMALSCENEEFTRFRLEHLRKLKPKVGEQEELERRQEMLSGAEDIRQSLREACDALEGSEGGALAEIREAREALRDLNFGLFETHDSEADLLHRLEMVQIELRDISETLSDYYSRVDSNPELLSRIESRLNQLYDAQRRFKVHDDSELVALKEQLESQLSQIESGDDSLAELEGEVKECGHKLKGLAAELTESRRKASAVVSERLIGMARELGMHNLKFAVTLEKVKLTADGGDSAEFMCAFNKNQTPVAAQKVASGGEISRLMLCIKAIVAHKMQLPTIIFDEVDTGVSGDIADRMGRLMQEISQSIQVIAITHLPQVAVKGATHFRVYKEDLANTTVTNIVKLSPREREEEIARMLSGAVIDQAAILNARALLGGTAGSGTEPGE